ncbi:MAG: tetraacyldisaccharide 4'-kinase [Aestuariibaculum sp.]
MKLIRLLLFPIVPVYFVITWLRNVFYDIGLKPSTSYGFPVICVGNLSVGGTGKTPMIEYLIRLLKDDYQVATLSRGYKRKTKGFQLADTLSDTESIGDEPFQFYHKFKNEILVAVDTNRVHGIAQLRQLDNDPDVILLDDAYQHRKVKAGLNILLTTYNKPYIRDIVLPTGNLREPRSGAKRARIIMVTKCPDNMQESEKQNIVKAIDPKPYQSVFFSYIVYANKVISYKTSLSLDSLSGFALVTGIANASTLVDYLKSKKLDFKHLNYGDHHEFSKQEIGILEKQNCIVTTEKDFMRLKHYESLKEKLFYLPIQVRIDREKEMNGLITRFIDCY